MEAEKFTSGIRQLAVKPFTGTQEDAEAQAGNIVSALFNSNGTAYQGVQDLMAEYGSQATPATVRAAIKNEPDVVIPELYRILRNKRGAALLINEEQFTKTLRAGFGLINVDADAGSGSGSGDDNGSGNDQPDDDDDSGDDSSADQSQATNGQSGQNAQIMGALMLVAGIGALYYLSR